MTNLRILLIVGDPEDVALVERTLAESTPTIVVAKTIVEAEDRLARERFDVILLDLRPSDVGLEESVSRTIAAAGSAPVVALATDDASTELGCLELGVQDFVRKSELQPTTLRRAIEYAIARSKTTETARRLELAERRAALGAIAPYVAHEVNNQLGLLDATTHLLRLLFSKMDLSADAALAADVDSNLALQEGAIERIAAVMKQLRAMGRPRRAARRDRESPSADVTATVDEVARAMTSRLRNTADVESRLEPDLRAAIEEGRLTQVILNLAENAADAVAGADGRARIEFVTTRREDRVIISVTDDGSGISPEIRSRLFEPFFTSKQKGTGLGLAIAAEIVREAGGRIDFEDLPRGTRFVVSLPLSHAEPADRAPSLAERRRCRVLYVDDNDETREVICRLLSARHDMVQADSGRRAIALLAQATRFDAILCDVMMPDMDGGDVYHLIRARYPDYVHRFAFLSGGAFSPVAEALVESGEARLLTKPCSLDEIERTILELAAR